MTIKIKNSDLINFFDYASACIKENPKTKLSHYLKSMIGENGSLVDIAKKFYKEKAKLELMACSVDADGNVLRHPSGSLKFTVPATLKLQDDIISLSEKEVEITEIEEFYVNEDTILTNESLFNKFLIIKKNV